MDMNSINGILRAVVPANLAWAVGKGHDARRVGRRHAP